MFKNVFSVYSSNSKYLLVMNTHCFIHVVIHSFPGLYVMIWREARKKRVDGKKENNKNHQPKLVLVTKKQMRQSQTLLPYEVFSYNLARKCLPLPWYIPCPKQTSVISIWEQILTVICKEKNLGFCPSSLYNRYRMPGNTHP